MKNLPPLTGTPKQIEWATKIRSSFLLPLFNREEMIEHHHPNVLRKLSEKDSASWWIDHRNTSVLDLVKNFEKEEATQAKRDELNAMFEEVAKEVIFEPEDAIGIVAEICLTGNNVCVYTPKNDEVIAYMKEMKFSFDGCWYHVGKEDLAAQVGDALLSLGVSIVLNNEVAREKMQNQTYQRYSPREIGVLKRKDELYFALHYPYSSHINDVSFKHLNARNYDGNRLVHRSKWASIQPFAEEFDFIMTEATQQLIEAMQSRVTLTVKKHEKDITETYAEPGVLSDLVDE